MRRFLQIIFCSRQKRTSRFSSTYQLEPESSARQNKVCQNESQLFHAKEEPYTKVAPTKHQNTAIGDEKPLHEGDEHYKDTGSEKKEDLCLCHHKEATEHQDQMIEATVLHTSDGVCLHRSIGSFPHEANSSMAPSNFGRRLKNNCKKTWRIITVRFCTNASYTQF